MSGLRKRWKVLVFVGCPVLVFLAAFVVLKLTEASVRREVEAERVLLARMGIDVGSFAPEENAYWDYKAIGPMSKQDHDPSSTLARLEVIAVKPFVFADNPGVRDPLESYTTLIAVARWIDRAYAHWVPRQDWRMLDRLYAFEQRYKKQRLLGEAHDSKYIRTVGGVGQNPLFFYGGLDAVKGELISTDPGRSWLRKKIEAIHPRRSQHEWLSYHATLNLPSNREQQPVTLQAATSREWWQELPRRQRLFRLQGELAYLRAVRQVSMQLEKRPLLVNRLDWERAMQQALKREQSEPASWASQGILTHWDPGTFYRHLDLVIIELAELREKGKPLVPSWSRKYCQVPGTNEPIKVTADKGTITFTVGEEEFTTSY